MTRLGKWYAKSDLIVISCCIVALALAAPAQAETGGILLVANGFDWTTPEGYLRNTSGDVVVQKVGRLTFTREGFDPIVVEPTITLQPGETRRIQRWDTRFDPGLWLLEIDPRVEASARLAFRVTAERPGGVTNFELEAVDDGIARNGEFRSYRRVAVDAASNTVTAPVFMNPNAEAVHIAIAVEGPLPDQGNVPIERLTIPPGVSQYLVQTEIPSGGTLRIYVSQPGELLEKVRVFVPTGPADGSTLAGRYPEPPE